MTLFAIGDFKDIRTLEHVTPERVILYFEPDLARNSTYAKDLAEFLDVPEHMRPFIDIAEFFDFQREMSPVFDESLAIVPLMVEIVGVETYEGNFVIKGLLPFLDELEFEEE